MLRRLCLAFIVTASGACGSDASGGDKRGRADGGSVPADGDGGTGGGDGSVTGTTPTPTPTPTNDELATAEGCPGVFNPGQLLDYELSMPDASWQTVLNDGTNSVYVEATLSCGDVSLQVGVRRKRSGEIAKPGLKVDINQFVPGQEYFSLRKLSLESGIGEGSTSASVKAILSEYLAWRVVQLTDTMGSRSSLVRLTVNGEVLGVYVNVEQVDKRFLKSRIGHNDGWLWKFSGSSRDGQKTNEGIDDPYDDYFCFFQKNGCAQPNDAQLLADLPGKLDIDQFLKTGAVNAILGNTDAPLFKDNNYIFYDYELGRVYFPWDLDTVMNADVDVVAGSVPGGVTFYTDVMFSNWRDDYIAHLTQMIQQDLSPALIESELDAIVAEAGFALEADPFLDGSAADASSSLISWWNARFPQVEADLGL